jgi:hypothetical protein
MVMTITSNPVAPRVDVYDNDQRPGSSDVAWAERAYRREEKRQANDRRTVLPRLSRRRLRVLLAIFVLVLAMTGLVLVMRYSGAASSPATTHPTSSLTVTVPQPTVGGRSLSPTPFIRTVPSLPPTFIIPRR